MHTRGRSHSRSWLLAVVVVSAMFVACTDASDASKDESGDGAAADVVPADDGRADVVAIDSGEEPIDGDSACEGGYRLCNGQCQPWPITFADPIELTTGLWPGPAAVGDFNHDGKLRSRCAQYREPVQLGWHLLGKR